MSTRSSIFYVDREANDGAGIHVYYELLDDDPNNVRMEIDTGFALVNVPIPPKLQIAMGIRKSKDQTL